MLRIALIDDHEIFRVGLRALLGSARDVEIVAEASDAASAIKIIRDHQPNLVILDYSMPGLTGLEVMQTIRERYSGVRVILLTASRSEAVVSEALAKGVQAVVMKQDASDELLQAIRHIDKQDAYLSKSVAALSERHDNLASLTQREKQVLRMVAQGYRNREIAESLHISLKTVDTHRTNLMRKLNLHSLVELVDLANKTGFVDSTI
ncbi:MAG: response regulator transcription factor [Pseudomonadales bacterium]|nr:response regulator transcription factor [Pseudomonadales bacterium]